MQDAATSLDRIIREKLSLTIPRHSAYSLGHNFVDASRSAKIPDETRMKFVGHQLEGVHGDHGNRWVLPDESAVIDTGAVRPDRFADYRFSKSLRRPRSSSNVSCSRTPALIFKLGNRAKGTARHTKFPSAAALSSVPSER